MGRTVVVTLADDVDAELAIVEQEFGLTLDEIVMHAIEAYAEGSRVGRLHDLDQYED